MQQEQQMLNNHIDSQGNSSVSKSQQTIFSDTSSQSKRKRESSNSAHGREWPTMNEEYSDSFKNWGLRVLNSSSSDKKKSVFKVRREIYSDLIFFLKVLIFLS